MLVFQIAVSEAIEKAVESLIIEGIEDKLWRVKAEPEKINELIADYNVEKNEAQNTGLYERYFKERRGEKALFANGGFALMSGDYNNADLSYSARIGGKWYFNPYLNANASIHKFQLRNEGAFSEGFNAIDVNAELVLLPFEKLSPFFFGGMGTVNSDDFDRTFFKFQYGGGIEYLISDQIGISANAAHNLVLSDKLDNVVQGKRDDQYFNFSIGVNWYFKKPLKMDKELRKQKHREQKELRKLKKRNRKVIENNEVPKG